MRYRVLPEFLSEWTNEDVEELIVTDVEIRRLAIEWLVSDDLQGFTNELYSQVEELDD